MKLQSLLQEESIDSLDISAFTSELNSVLTNNLKEVFLKFKQFNKITLNDISEGDIFLHITDGIVDFDLEFSKDGAGDVVVEIASMVNHRFVYNHEHLSETDSYKYALSNTFARSFSLNRKQRLLDYVDHIVQVAEKFNEWYFELSGKYGKMKLTKVPYDITTGSTNSDWKWMPVGGVFLAAGLVGSGITAEVL